MNQLYPETGMNTVNILEKLGCEIIYNDKQTCCGKPAFEAGYVKESKAVCSKFLNDFDPNEIIVTPSGNCAGFIRSKYETLFADNLQLDQAIGLRSKVYELSEFLLTVLKVTDIGASLHGVATYHDACGALRNAHIQNGPRRLLQQVSGLTLLESPACKFCCGFGGSLSKKMESISKGMAHTVIQAAVKLNADYIISTDVDCLMQLSSYSRQHQHKVKCLHLADVLSLF